MFNREQQKASRCFMGKDLSLTYPYFQGETLPEKEDAGEKKMHEDGTSRKEIKTEEAR